MKNLKKFLTVTGYTEYAMSQNFIVPNVSFVKESDNVIYNRTKPQKHEAQINAIYKEQYSNYNVVIKASVIGDGTHTPTGTATLSINGTTQTKSVNALSFDVLIEEDGTYSFTLTYNGDDFYETALTQGSFDVHDYSKDYFTFDIISAGTIEISQGRWANPSYYSKDNGLNWEETPSDEEFSVSAGDKILLKSVNSYTPLSLTDTGTSATFNVEGNIMSLIYGDEFVGQTNLKATEQFQYLFNGVQGLVSAKNLVLPATVLTRSCYDSMFRDCTSLITSPELPATTLAESCYQSMFYGCSLLTTAPSILPATTLAESCYDSMFNGCTSLTTAPELPATALASSCYSYMFYKCASLNYVKCLATDISANNCTYEWIIFSDGSGSGSGSDSVHEGTFVKNPNMNNWERGSNGIPEDWEVQDAS